MVRVGIGSMPLVLVTSIFTGGVAAVQAAYQFQDYVPMRYLGTVIGKSVVIELGPVLTALVVGGRVGASIAAELGTMKVTEQIDALETMAIDPVRYLVAPRLIACRDNAPGDHDLRGLRGDHGRLGGRARRAGRQHPHLLHRA